MIILEVKRPDSRGSQESADADQVNSQASKAIGDAENNYDSGQLDVSSLARIAVTPSDGPDNVLKLPRLTAVLEIAERKSKDVDDESENDDEDSIHGKA